jgi:hypothetical protein
MRRSRLLIALLIALLPALAFAFWPRLQPPFYFQVTIRSALDGFAEVYYDTGSKEQPSSRLPVQGDNHEVDCKFPLPQGAYPGLRFDPIDRGPTTMVLSKPRITDRNGNIIRVIAPDQIVPSHQIEKLEPHETDLSLTIPQGADDPRLAVQLRPPVVLKNYESPSARTLVRRFVTSFLAFFALGLLASPFVAKIATRARLSALSRLSDDFRTWARIHPGRVVFLTAALSVVLSCYPVVFFGKSFLSPNNHSHTFLLYGDMPTVPGSTELTTDDEKGADLGASMWYSWPTSVVESRALFKDWQLPLWNRYDSAGLPLLGQGQSMFGDPLHLLVLFTKGSALAWDLKYLLAKLVFTACIGLSALQLTRHLPAATIVAASGAFICFFAYRYSHPAYFSMCYAPAVLLAWLKLNDAPDRRASAVWLAILVLANWTLMNSGTVKEAYVLLLAMNSCGCLSLLLRQRVPQKWMTLARALFALLLFGVIATPVWLTFLKALRSSWTFYGTGVAQQLQPGVFVGLFDDIFYRQLNPGESHLDPAANFLVLGAVIWFCYSRQRMDSERRAWGVIVTCCVALAFAFGLIPSALFVDIRFLGQIHHIDNTFSCVAIICLILLAAFGIRAFWQDCQNENFRTVYWRFLGLLLLLLAIYLGTTGATSRATLLPGVNLAKSSFFWGYSTSLILALVLLPLLGRKIIDSPRPASWQIIGVVLAFLLLHWRSGMHLTTPFDAYVMNPHERADLIADSSPALKLIKERMTEPARVLGLNYNFFPGYGGAVELEQVDGPDALFNKHYRSLMDVSGVVLQYCSSQPGLVDEHLERDLPMFDMLNVRFMLGRAGTTAEAIPSLNKVAALDLRIYESRKAWPRAFFTDRLVPYAADAEFVGLVKAGKDGPFAAIPREVLDVHPELTASLAKDGAFAGQRVVNATQYALNNNNTSFKISAPSAGVVVLTEPYVENDFELRINGKPSEYFRVNSAFRGVYLNAPGDYDISFSYWPRHFTSSLWIAAMGLIVLSLWLTLVWRSSNREA